MKKVLTIVAFVGTAMATMAQTGGISLFVYAPAQPEEVPQASVDYLVNNLCTAVTSDGLAAQSDFMTQFLLLPKINVASKKILAGTPQQQVVQTLDVSLQVVDGINGTVYASKTISLKGVGTNETKSYNAAFRTLSKSHSQIKAFVSDAKKKILAYYEAEAPGIIKRAETLATQEKFDEAFHMLSMIPSQCSKSDDAISAGLAIWEKHKNTLCSRNLAKAKSAWVARQDYDAAQTAGAYLAQILPDMGCYGEARQLYDEIKKVVGERWQFEMSAFKDEQQLRLAKVKAIQEIGVAYGKGQQPEQIVNKSIL